MNNLVRKNRLADIWVFEALTRPTSIKQGAFYNFREGEHINITCGLPYHERVKVNDKKLIFVKGR